MKAFPIVLFVFALLFAVIEWQHSRVHETALANANVRLNSIQIPGERPVSHLVIKKIEPGALKIGKIGPHVPIVVGKTMPPSSGAVAPPSSSTAPTVNEQVAAAKADQAVENKTVQESHDSLISMRVILTILFVPACFFIIFAKKTFDETGRGFAYTTLGTIVTFWLHS